mmetsp:Transcript_74755/g.177850  ORF Transcript_74755/g.177850 Transcript_74755/m.177850 type:complete len:249 (+) Transcript_74755:73-819(+)
MDSHSSSGRRMDGSRRGRSCVTARMLAVFVGAACSYCHTTASFVGHSRWIEQHPRHRPMRPSRVTTEAWVSHTEVAQAKSGNVEKEWSLPDGATRGSLLQQAAGKYVSVFEWPSQEAFFKWLCKDASRAEVTTLFEQREQAAASSAVMSFIDDDDDRDDEVWGGDPSFEDDRAWQRARGPGSSEKSEDTRPLAGAVGLPIGAEVIQESEVDMDEEDEVLFFGGDPSFMDDSLWEKPEASDTSKSASSK